MAQTLTVSTRMAWRPIKPMCAPATLAITGGNRELVCADYYYFKLVLHHFFPKLGCRDTNECCVYSYRQCTHTCSGDKNICMNTVGSYYCTSCTSSGQAAPLTKCSECIYTFQESSGIQILGRSKATQSLELQITPTVFLKTGTYCNYNKTKY